MKARRVIWTLVVIAIGVLWIAHVYGWVDFSWLHRVNIGKIIIPALIVLVGVWMLFHAFSPRRCGTEHGCRECPQSAQDERNAGAQGNKVTDFGQDCQVCFSGRTIDYHGQPFNGININVFCGGVRLDLRGAEIQEGAGVSVRSLLGGVEIYLDENVDVEMRSNCILGGVGDEGRRKSPRTKKLHLDASCMCGGVSLK